MDRESVYLKLPIPLQNLACSVEGFRIQRSRFGGDFSQILGECESRSFLSSDEVSELRNRRLSRFVRHAYETTVFYKKQFDDLGVHPEDIRDLQDLACLPILTKEVVQENLSDLISSAVPSSRQVWVHTSGTTGGGLRFPVTLQAQQEQWAIWWRYRKWHGVSPDALCGYFGGRSVVPLSQKEPPFWRFNVPGRQILFSGYHMNHENLESYIALLNRKKPEWLHGYPSLLALVAGHILETGSRLSYPLKWVTIGAESLLPHQVKLMEEAFGIRPIQHYGMAEGTANISECSHGFLHVDEDFAGVEFVSNPFGDGYKVIGTNFTNPSFPLLRYDTQDLVDLEGGSRCSCGRPGRIVKAVDGRKEDYVILKDGTRVGRMDHIFKDMINIKEAQIIQKEIGKLNINIVPRSAFSDADEVILRNEVIKRVGSETEIHIQKTRSLRRSRSGKLRFVLNEIDF